MEKNDKKLGIPHLTLLKHAKPEKLRLQMCAKL